MGGVMDDGVFVVMEGGLEFMSKNVLKKFEKVKKVVEEKWVKEEVKKVVVVVVFKKVVKVQQVEDDEDMDFMVSGNGSRGGFIVMGGIWRF